MLTRIDHGMLVIEIFTYIRLSAFGIVGVLVISVLMMLRRWDELQCQWGYLDNLIRWASLTVGS